jgi:cytochrome c peroxidase
MSDTRVSTSRPGPDLGVAMISGKCDDIGKTEAPVLRGLTGRSPYFHNGSALEIEDLINFYDQRFNVRLTLRRNRIRRVLGNQTL